MIDDFADRILVIRNLTLPGEGLSVAQSSQDELSKSFQDELSKHHASSVFRQELPYAERAEFITGGKSTPSDHAGVTVKQQGHIRTTTITMPMPTGFWGCEKLVDLEQIELLGRDNLPLAAVLIDTIHEKVTFYEKGFSGPVAQLSHFDDDEKETYEASDSWHGWKASYPAFSSSAFEYHNNDGQFPVGATLGIGKDKAVFTMSTPSDLSPVLRPLHRITLYIDHDRISHRAEWTVDSLPGSI